MTDPKKEQDPVSEEALEAFLQESSKALGEQEGSKGLLSPEEPSHRHLRVIVSSDGLQAEIEAVYADTPYEEVQEALRRERVVWGIEEASLEGALKRAQRSGRLQRGVLAAKGKEAVYLKRKEVSYPFLDVLKDPEPDESVHLASSFFREISEVLGWTDVEKIRGYGRPVVAAAKGETLMSVQGEEEIEPGCDVFGKDIKSVKDEGPATLKPGEGVDILSSGSLVASRFGYVSIVGGFLSAASSVWISEDHMAAYFVNPPQLGARKVPDPETVLEALRELGVSHGIDEEEIKEMCSDLARGNTRESCVRIARGEQPKLSKGQIGFTFEPLPEARFEAIQQAFKTIDFKEVTGIATPVHAAHADAVLAEQVDEKEKKGPGTDLFGEPVAPPEEVQEEKAFKAGINVRRESEQGRIRYISEIYGYAGIVENEISVVSPIWISPDKMKVYFVGLPLLEMATLPKEEEVEGLLERAKIRHGIDPEVLERVCTVQVLEHTEPHALLLAQGTPPEPGEDGSIELRFKRAPEPGDLLEDGAMDFRERDALPNVETDQLLASRSLPTPGKPGKDVRGRELKAPKSKRDLLFAGPSVVSKEEEGVQCFYATAAGFARVVKDTLSVMNRFRHPDDLDYKIGNIKFDGDVEIGGSVKSRFKVEATGDVYVDGTVERGATLIAGGDIAVRGGILGAKIKTGGSLFARFIKDSSGEVGENLVVRNYVEDSEIKVEGKATVQGNEGGEKHLCLLGGTLLATSGIEAASVGTRHGRKTRVVSGISPALEERLNEYRQAFSFCELRTKQAMRGLSTIVGRSGQLSAIAEAIKAAPPGRREFLMGKLQELKKLSQLKVSIEHHVEEMGARKEELLKLASIRVVGSVFPRVTLQIGDTYTTLEEETPSLIFRLNSEGNRIAHELM